MTTATTNLTVETALADYDALRARITEAADRDDDLLTYGEIETFVATLKVSLTATEQKQLATEIGIPGRCATGKEARFEINYRLRRTLESYQRTRF